MTYIEFKNEVLALALKLGCAAAETVFTEGNSFSVGVLDQEIDDYSVAKDFGMGLRVELDGKNGYAYTEMLDDADALVKKAMDNARVIGSDDVNPMQGPQEYKDFSYPENPACDMSEAEKIELSLDMERRLKAIDPRIVRISGQALSTGESFANISNTLGLDASRRSRYCFAYIGAIAQSGEEMRNEYAFRSGKDVLDIDSLVKEAAEETLCQLGASSVDSGEYRVVFRNTAVGDFIDAFSPMFSADQSQRGLSPLTGHEGEQLAPEFFDLIDDPWYETNPRAFDDEGTPSVATSVITGGRFNSFLHNLKTAKKAGCASTSNASRAFAGSPVRVAPSNFYIKAGDVSYDELLEKLGNGLVITQVSGLHSGLNAVSGEFSLLSQGFLVENGKIVRPVEQITIAGTFFDFLKNVELVGSDLRFGMPQSSMVGTPSLLISKLAIAGK